MNEAAREHDTEGCDCAIESAIVDNSRLWTGRAEASGNNKRRNTADIHGVESESDLVLLRGATLVEDDGMEVARWWWDRHYGDSGEWCGPIVPFSLLRYLHVLQLVLEYATHMQSSTSDCSHTLTQLLSPPVHRTHQRATQLIYCRTPIRPTGSKP